MRVWVLAAVAFAAAVTSGCGVAPTPTKSLTGQVSEVDGTVVCVAAPEASGECFVKNRVTSSMRVGDCVTVTFYSPEQRQPGPLTARNFRAAKCPAT